MSLFFTVLFKSFLNWFQTIFYWSYKVDTKKIKKVNFDKFFFLKKSFFIDRFELFILFFLNLFVRLHFLKNVKQITQNGLLGLKSIWLHLRFWILPLILSITVFINFMHIKALPFNKVIFLWTAVFMIYYWLISGFVFFIKKYQYGKYTSAIQRFWKRSYIIFWLLETCLLLVFVYLTFTASQESFYMFDQIQVYKTHLFSWRLFLYKNIPVIILISIGYFLVLTLKWNTFSKHSIWLLCITFILTYVIWIEFYQFYHIVNFYGNLNWVYDFDDKVWNLELEARRTRIVNNYVMLLLILRFWHLIFVYIFWLFFVLRGCEIKRLRYPLLAANFQNFIILYIMNWITMYPWFKLTFRKYLNQPYTVFNVNNRNLFSRVFFNDIKLFMLNMFDSDFFYFKNYFNKDFFYFIEWNKSLNNQHIRKHYIKNNIIVELKTLNNDSSSSFSSFNEVLNSLNNSWSTLFNYVESLFNFFHFNLVFDFLLGIVRVSSTFFNFLQKTFEFFISSFNSLIGFVL